MLMHCLPINRIHSNSTRHCVGPCHQHLGTLSGVQVHHFDTSPEGICPVEVMPNPVQRQTLCEERGSLKKEPEGTS